MWKSPPHSYRIKAPRPSLQALPSILLLNLASTSFQKKTRTMANKNMYGLSKIIVWEHFVHDMVINWQSQKRTRTEWEHHEFISPHPPTIQQTHEPVQFETRCLPESCFGALRLLVLACRSLTWLNCELHVKLNKDCRQSVFLLYCSRRYFTLNASLVFLFQLSSVYFCPEGLLTPSDFSRR